MKTYQTLILREEEGGAPPAGGSETPPPETPAKLGGNAPPAKDPPKDPPSSNWREMLSEDLREDPTLKNIKAENVQEALNEASKQLVNAQKVIGKDKIPALKPDATPEERLAWRQEHLGVPKDATEYELPDMESLELKNEINLDDEKVEAFRKFAQEELQIPKEEFGKLIEFYLKDMDGSLESQKTLLSQRQEENLNQLREEWGSDKLDANLKIANAVLDRMPGGSDLLEALNESGLHTDPRIIKAIHGMQDQFLSDDFRGSGSNNSLDPKVVGTRRLEEMASDKEFQRVLHSRDSKDRDAHDRAVQEHMEAMVQATHGVASLEEWEKRQRGE